MITLTMQSGEHLHLSTDKIVYFFQVHTKTSSFFKEDTEFTGTMILLVGNNHMIVKDSCARVGAKIRDEIQ